MRLWMKYKQIYDDYNARFSFVNDVDAILATPDFKLFVITAFFFNKTDQKCFPVPWIALSGMLTFFSHYYTITSFRQTR